MSVHSPEHTDAHLSEFLPLATAAELGADYEQEKQRATLIPGAYVVFMNAQGQILLLQRAESVKFGEGKWEFPGGKWEPCSQYLTFSPEPMRFSTVARREAEEETGLEAGKNMQLLGRRVFIPNPHKPNQAFYFVFFLNTSLVSETQAVQCSSEHTAARWTDVENLEKTFDLMPTVNLVLFEVQKFQNQLRAVLEQ